MSRLVAMLALWGCKPATEPAGQLRILGEGLPRVRREEGRAEAHRLIDQEKEHGNRGARGEEKEAPDRGAPS